MPINGFASLDNFKNKLDKLPLIGNCDIIIAVDIMPIEKMDKIEGVSKIIARLFQMGVSMQQNSKENCDLVITLEGLSNYGILDTHQNKEIFEFGYNYVKNTDVSGI